MASKPQSTDVAKHSKHANRTASRHGDSQDTDVAKVSKYANRTTFRKGDGRARRGHAQDRMSRECKEMIATCFDKMGGLEGLYAWATSTDERRDAFYTRIYPRLIAVQLDMRSHKDVVYHSSDEIKDAFGAAGMTLELIERLRQREAEQPKPIEHVRVD